jgi:hypothetical protein
MQADDKIELMFLPISADLPAISAQHPTRYAGLWANLYNGRWLEGADRSK